MGTVRRQLLLNSLKLFDLVLMITCFLLASFSALHLSRSSSFTAFLSMRISVFNFMLFFLLLWVWHMILSLFGLYRSRRLSTHRADVIDSFEAITAATLVLYLASHIFHIRMVSGNFVLIFWGIVTFTEIASRVLLRIVLEQVRRRGRNLRNVLIIGTNRRAVELASTIEHMPELGYRILGFVDDDWAGLHTVRANGYEIICDLNGLPAFLREAVVDEVIIGLPIRSFHESAARIAAICEEQGITTRILSKVFDQHIGRTRARELDNAMLITHYTGLPEAWQVVAKRLLDIILSVLLLGVFAPILLLVSILVKLTSTGPIFFVQHRLGINKRRFAMYKFRTMVADAEEQMANIEHLNEATGPVFKIKNDPRITALGKFLRKTSIDELPQLINVLKGDMSLVGPRPLPIRDYKGFNQDSQRRRFSVRPGITCLWQIGGRSSIAFDKWMQLDLQYIDEWSLWLDVEILLKTVPAVLRGSGAA